MVVYSVHTHYKTQQSNTYKKESKKKENTKWDLILVRKDRTEERERKRKADREH